MDKVFSTRLDESVVRRIGLLAQQLGMTKKAIIETAIQTLAEKVSATYEIDIWKQTCGAWHRTESPQTTVESARGAFRKSMQRHHR
ncbi:MAG: hypothetical protein O7E52_10305 [Candidatus Poribacteria bacterium]|nr:hypothetical protein [Candidatus Poribacteria bacterium]